MLFRCDGTLQVDELVVEIRLGQWLLGAGVAIDTGAGNDIVTLGDYSVTGGHIMLGSGDDTLTIGQEALTIRP